MTATATTIVYRTDVNPDGVVIYESPSRTTPGTMLHPVVNLSNGFVDCDCPDFNYRKYPQAKRDGVRPDIGTPRYHCKHIEAAVRDCIDNGEILVQVNKPQEQHEHAKLQAV